MHVTPSPDLAGQFIEAVETNKIRINRDYQRGSGVWPTRAKSALIETMILGYAMPALFLYQVFDKETRKTYRELVDGQQRTEAILQFASSKLRLSKTLPTERLRDRTIAELDEDDYKAFMSYSLPAFTFVDATETDIREAFRRINSHTATLNPEEKRHATYHGEMKWLVLQISKDVQPYLEKWQVYARNKLIRMADAKFVSEVIHVLLTGIRTVKSNNLDQLYKEYDAEGSVPNLDSVQKEINHAFRLIEGWDWIASSPMVKSYQLTLLIVALIHAQKPVKSLNQLVKGGVGLVSPQLIIERLSLLAEALDGVGDEFEEDEEEGASSDDESDDSDTFSLDLRLDRFRDFVKASKSSTNTVETRKTRFLTFFDIVTKPEW